VWLPVRFDEKMTDSPSGVHVGVPPSASSKVSRRGVPPDDGTIQRSPIGPPLDWKNTINRPSGEIAGVDPVMYVSGGTAAASTMTFDPSFQTVSAAGNDLIRERQPQFAVRIQF
jgi:hypothetical protein